MEKEQKFLFYFRLTLFGIALLTNIVFYMIEIPFTWAIFLSNIILFGMPASDLKEHFFSVEIGGAVGLLSAIFLLVSLTILEPFLGKLWSFALPLGAILFVLIVLQPIAPRFFNSTGFAYMNCACIAPAIFAENFAQVILTFLCGSLMYNGLCFALLWIFKRFLGHHKGK